MYENPYAAAHREWHVNAGVPMGQPGCPQDACGHDEPDPDVVIVCGHCHELHYGWDRADVIREIKACAAEEYAGRR